LEFYSLIQCTVLSDFVSVSESQNIMQVAPCTLHDDPFKKKTDHTKVSPLYEENFGRASQAIIIRTDIKQAYMGCQLFTAINQNKKMYVTKLTVFNP